MRIFIDLLLFLGVLLAPFWCVAAIALIGILLIPGWYEMVGAWVLFELLFHGAPPSPLPFFLNVPLSVYALIVVLFGEWVRTRIRERTL